MHLALFQSPDTVPLALPAVDDRIKPYIPELNQFPGTFPTKLEIIEQSSANVMILKNFWRNCKVFCFLRSWAFFLKNYSISIFLKLECQKMFLTKVQQCTWEKFIWKLFLSGLVLKLCMYWPTSVDYWALQTAVNTWIC